MSDAVKGALHRSKWSTRSNGHVAAVDGVSVVSVVNRGPGGLYTICISPFLMLKYATLMGGHCTVISTLGQTDVGVELTSRLSGSLLGLVKDLVLVEAQYLHMKKIKSPFLRWGTSAPHTNSARTYSLSSWVSLAECRICSHAMYDI